MAQLKQMPEILIKESDLLRFGKKWIKNGGSLARTPPESSLQFGYLFDKAVGEALSIMLGGIPVVIPSSVSLIPSQADCVEVGPVKIVGGVRSQNFDVGYRPDGPRFVFDSKTLNDSKSLGKNFLNMVNDLATEATTTHIRFPHSIVAFMFVVPKPCLDDQPRRSSAAIQILDRLARREAINDPMHLAEVISVIVWDPHTGKIFPEIPSPESHLRIDNFSSNIERIYYSRYKGLPPHAGIEENDEAEE